MQHMHCRVHKERSQHQEARAKEHAMAAAHHEETASQLRADRLSQDASLTATSRHNRMMTTAVKLTDASIKNASGAGTGASGYYAFYLQSVAATHTHDYRMSQGQSQPSRESAQQQQTVQQDSERCGSSYADHKAEYVHEKGIGMQPAVQPLQAHSHRYSNVQQSPTGR